MKNHIVFKMIAIVLCAASLLGVVAGIGGVTVLSSENLYNRTVDDMLTENMEWDSLAFADWLAKNYASTELGGCPEAMVNSQYGGHWFERRYDDFGYSILDAEGQELLSVNPEYRDTAPFVRTYPVEGKYLHLVSMETESQQEAREAELRMESYGLTPAETLKGSTLPEEGTGVSHAVFADTQGNLIMEAFVSGDRIVVNFFAADHGFAENAVAGSQVGYLYYDRENRLVFRSVSYLGDVTIPQTITDTMVGSAYFLSANGEVDVALESKEGIGLIEFRDDAVIFRTLESVVEEAPAVPEVTVAQTEPETIPETTTETIPETTAETVAETAPQESPAETAVQETAVQETVPAETVPSSASAVPEEETVTEETHAAVTEPAEAQATVVQETVPAETAAPETVPQETVPPETAPPQTEPQPVMIHGKRLEEYQVNRFSFYDNESGENVTAQYIYLPIPEIQVEVYLPEGAVRSDAVYNVLRLIRQFRNFLMPIALGCLILFALCVVYLCTAAGRKPKSEDVQAAGLNRLPLDLYLALSALAVGGLLALLAVGSNQLFETDFVMASTAVTAGGFLCCLIFVGFFFAFVAQLKMQDGYWIKNTLICRSMTLCVRLFLAGIPLTVRGMRWSWKKIIQVMIWLYKVTEKAMLWTARKLNQLFHRMGRQTAKFYGMLPLIWQWLAGGCVAFLFSLLVLTGEFLGVIVGLGVPIVIIIYFAKSFGVLAESTRRMSRGDLDTKVDDSKLVGCFKQSAADLNTLADVVVMAAQKQLKSERMKTELITNVSHDIKTPLTSIINYVDLLQKPHTEEEEQQYLEVLDRQSQRLKKLIDDLMDMSKASTGNMAVEITRVDAVESVNQALGEFADKLNRAQLIPVFRHEESTAPMMADGKMVWRVLSNLLGNAVKYAMPGTRVYIDLQSMDDKVVISLKNISREELNVDSEELMERFVRGDDSRNTEGSGLGLNIAKSLMELQKGQLQLLVDGDLFKVTLIFPGE